LSLRELWNELRVARRRDEQQRQQIWWTAALTRVKDMPRLDEFIGRPAARQTLAQQRVALMVIFGHGGQRKAS